MDISHSTKHHIKHHIDHHTNNNILKKNKTTTHAHRYLSEVAAGGETVFPDSPTRLPMSPQDAAGLSGETRDER